MPEIVTADLNRIANNPYRRLHAYPFIEGKLAALQRSIEDVGLWPSIMARPLKEKLWDFELAFGHHRLEAARRQGLKKVQLIVEHLSDRDMLQYMGRENLEDYDSSFLIQLESWEAAVKSGLVRSASAEQASQPLEIAKLLGWTVSHKDNRAERTNLVMNDTARACAAAYALIEGGYHTRETYAGLSVRDARNIAETAVQLQQRVDSQAKQAGWNQRQKETYRRQAAGGAADTAEQLRKGAIKRRDTRDHIHYNTLARNRGRATPLLAILANEIARSLARTLQGDSEANKLAEIVSILPQIEMLEDWEALGRVQLELTNLARRAEGWERRLTPSKEKVVHFRALEGTKA